MPVISLFIIDDDALGMRLPRSLSGARPVLLFLFFLLSFLVPLREAPAQDNPGEPIIVLGDRNFPPYEFLEGDTPRGANVDLWAAIGRVLKRPVEIRLMKWSEAQERILGGEGHALTLMTANEEREKLYDFTDPTLPVTFSFFVRTGETEEFPTASLEGKRIGVAKGGFPILWLKSNRPEAELVIGEDQLDGFGKLLRGEIDAVAHMTWSGYYTLRENDIESIQAVPRPFAKKFPGIPVPKGNSALVEELNRAIRVLRQNGEFERIADKWSGKKIILFEQRQFWFITITTVLSFLVLMLGVVLVFVMKSRKATLRHAAMLQKEITERKQAEGRLTASLEEKEVLLREIHHRVKNNLQVISSILSLQASTETDDRSLKALDDSQRRVKIMARIHETLHRSDDLSSINIRDYLNTVVEDTIASSENDTQRISYRLDTDDIIFDVDHAVACGQIISELLSNSLKHAFPNGQSGKVEVALRRRDGARVELTVADDGKGLPEDLDLQQTETLGMRLIHALVMQLSGVVNVDGSGGTRVQITFPEKPS